MANTNNHTHNHFMDSMKMFMDGNMMHNMMQASNSMMQNMMNANNMMKMGNHKMPDMSAMQRRNTKSMTEASKAVTDAMQEMMRLSASAAKNMASEMFSIASCNPVMEGANCKHKASMQNMMNTTVSTMKDASKIMMETGMDLYDKMTKTMSDNIA